MFKVLTEGCTPTRGTKYSACVDLYSSEDVVIGAGETKIIGLGVAIDEIELREIELDYKNNRFLSSHYLQVALRSSLGKAGLIMPNGVGIIDMDYRDEIKVIIHNPINYDQYEFEIKKGQRIAQITLLEHKSYLFGIESDVVRNGGLGSTDTVS